VAISFRRADLALFLNEDDRRLAVDRLGVAEDRAFVVANGLPDDLIGVPVEIEEHVAGGTFGVAVIGSYIERKGIRYGAPALTEVLRRHPEATVSFLGTSFDTARVHADFPAELHDRVRVVPRFERSRLPELLHGHHVLLFPTLSEGFGKSLLEAMAGGLSAVTTATAGPRRLVEDGVHALVVPPRDAGALEAALERLIADPPLLARLRRAAYEHAQQFAWSRVARERIALYERALAERP
jgi:glycosyltransferase involved in cell wall biosynthesis